MVTEFDPVAACDDEGGQRSGARIPAPPRAAAKKPYRAPELTSYGSVCQLTHGSVGGRGDGKNSKRT
jgi:hypothetical protein